jgi:hypothetical protein
MFLCIKLLTAVAAFISLLTSVKTDKADATTLILLTSVADKLTITSVNSDLSCIACAVALFYKHK